MLLGRPVWDDVVILVVSMLGNRASRANIGLACVWAVVGGSWSRGGGE